MTDPLRSVVRSGDGVHEVDLVFPAGADYFDGHFADAPVLAGVVQTGTAVRELALALGRPVRLREIRKLKFMRVVHPGEALHLRLARKSDGEWTFSYTCADGPCTSGIFIF